MRTRLLLALLLACLFFAGPWSVRAEDKNKDALQAVWVAQSMEVDGKAAPAEAVKRMQFTFNADKLLVQGNSKSDDEEEMECDYKIDAAQTPKHLEFTPPEEPKETILGIYDLNGDELKVCLRHGSSNQGRPKEFATKEGAELILIVFKKKK